MRASFFLFTLCVLLSVCTASAQNLVVYRTDGTQIEVPIDEIDSLCITPEQPFEPTAVDLGLSVLWATCNVGAEKPTQVGDYFAWGEVTGKDEYSEDSYAYYQSGAYEHIGTNICSTQYDAARAVWGSDWRMPNLIEINELLNKCTWTATTQKGVAGYTVTGSNGNSIFLPSAGCYQGTTLMGAGTEGYYWSGSTTTTELSSAYNINFSGYTGKWMASRAYGFTIRAVRKK